MDLKENEMKALHTTWYRPDGVTLGMLLNPVIYAVPTAGRVHVLLNTVEKRAPPVFKKTVSGDKPVVNDKRIRTRDKIMQYFIQNGAKKASATQIADKIGLSRETVRHELSRMVAWNMVRQRRVRRGSCTFMESWPI